MIHMSTDYGPLGDGRRAKMGNVIQLRGITMCRVDERFSEAITQALALADWSMNYACQLSDIPYVQLNESRNGNRILSNDHVQRLITAFVAHNKIESANIILEQFVPSGVLVDWRSAQKSKSSWSENVAAEQRVIADIVQSIEDGSVTLSELNRIEHSLRSATSMIMDKIVSTREEIEQRRERRIAGAPIQARA